jgi:polysaccharide export outer membrane protein
MNLAVLAVILGGCASSAQTKIGIVDSAPVSAYGQSDYSAVEKADYRLRPSDVVTITVFREPDLSVENTPVGADGMLSLPLVGSIKVDGLTARQLEQEVRSKLAPALVDPNVSVNIMQFGSHVVTVEGAVEKPGMYAFKPGTRLSGAISLAAGPSRVAKLTEIAVFRQTASGMAVAKFDYAAVRAGTMMDPVLEPSDRIVLGTSGLSVFWQDLLKTLPAFALFTNL